MSSNLVKKVLSFIAIGAVMAIACDLSVSVAPSTNQAPTQATALPPTLLPNPTPTASHTSFEGEEVSVYPLTIHLSPELAGGVHSSQFARVDGEDAAWWQKTPGHTELKLEGYLLQEKFHQPQILVYPAQAYAELVPTAFESMHRLNNILGGLPISSQGLPAIPFFNAQQAFASNIQIISFQNGRGVRFLTEYAQYPLSANNTDLVYHFQGLTGDGAYYVVAILPITAPVLAETSDPGAVLPPGGVPYPYFAEGLEADMQSYYTAITALLDGTSPEAFTPTINQLDLLIQSMRIAP